MTYKDFTRNHAVLPSRLDALEAFLKQHYKGMQHKWKNAVSSHSEDALTWSCFDLLSNLPLAEKTQALDELFEDAYQGAPNILLRDAALTNDQMQIFIGKQYTGATSRECSEIDASIELPGKLVFVEAKLYSSVSPASPPKKPHDQIARKLRIGLDTPLGEHREFYFIFLDIAPPELLIQKRSKAEALGSPNGGFDDKWRSAWLFNYYKHGRNNSLSPLSKALEGIDAPPATHVADNMGWLTWSDLFKTVLRALIRANARDAQQAL